MEIKSVDKPEWMVVTSQPGTLSAADAAGSLAGLSPFLISQDSSQPVSDEAFLDILSTQLANARIAGVQTSQTAARIKDQLSQVDISQLRKIDGASKQLEALLLETLLKQMWATLPKTSLLGNGLEAKYYREMWLQQLAGQIAVDGQGLGIAAALNNEMISQYLPANQPESILPLSA